MNAAKRFTPGAEVVDAVALALAFHRAPASHADLLHGIKPLPESMGGLLRLAAGTAANDVSPALVTLAPQRDLQIAARFFIEQVLFRHNAHYFRILGVNPGADIEQIKEHHRLLMRLFHPDRETPGGKEESNWKETYATRVNLAYNALRDADSRSRYLATLKPQALRSPVNTPPANISSVSRATLRRVGVESDTFWALHMGPVLKRYLPQWVLGGTALLGLLLVTAVYLSNVPVDVARTEIAEMPLAGAQAAGASNIQPTDRYDTVPAPLPVIEQAKEQALKLEATIARFERRGHEAAVQIVPTQTQSPVKFQPDQILTPRISPDPAKPAVWIGKNVAHPLSQPVAAPASRDIRQNTVFVLSESRSLSSAVVPATQVAPQSTLISPPIAGSALVQWNPSALLAQLAEAYERGDTKDVMDMFDETARTSSGSWIETQRDYEEWFRNTDLRYLKLDNMAWNSEGEILKGQGKYRMTQMRKGETILKNQSGSVRIDLVRRGRFVLIAAFYLAPGHSP